MIGATRRTVLLGGLAGLAGATLASPVRASGDSIAFDVVREGQSIGSHRLRFDQTGGEVAVDIAIDLEVRFAWVPVFRYGHVNREIWRDGRLQRLDSRTHDDGRDHAVTARQVDGRLLVDGDDGQIEVEPSVLTTSYWHPASMMQQRLLDTQRGRLAEVSTQLAGSDRLAVAGRQIVATRYDVLGDLTMTTWYGPEGQWSGLAFEARGSTITYRAVEHLTDERWSAIVAGMVG